MPSEPDATARWLSDIHHHIAMVERFVSGMNYETFRDDDRTVYAVTRCLEIISEASRRLPDEAKARHPAIEWREMAAAGNVYRHDYEDVEAHWVWRTASTKLPPLRVAIEREMARGPEETN